MKKETKFYFEDNLFYTAFALSREVAAITEETFMELGLTPSDAYLILMTHEKPNIQPTEVSERVLLAPSTITRMIEKLEKRGFVARTTEGKYTFIRLTDSGNELHPHVLRCWNTIHDRFHDLLGAQTINQLNNDNAAAAATLKQRNRK